MCIGCVIQSLIKGNFCMMSRRSGVESIRIAGSSLRLLHKESVTTPATDLQHFTTARMSS